MKKVLCIVLAVVLCISLGSVAFAEESPVASWIEMSGVPEDVSGNVNDLTDAQWDSFLSYAADNFDADVWGGMVYEIGDIMLTNGDGSAYTGSASFRIYDADVTAADKVMVLHLVGGSVEQIPATAYDGYFEFTTSSTSPFAYMINAGGANAAATTDPDTTTTSTTTTSPKTGNDNSTMAWIVVALACAAVTCIAGRKAVKAGK